MLPVSYTHLDVYKRQDNSYFHMRFFFNVFLQTKVTVNCEKTKSSLNKKCFSVRGCFFVRCLLTVSYTHLQMPELSPLTYGHTDARLILRVGGSMGDVYGQRLLKRDLNGYILNEEGVGLAMENKETYLGSILPKMNMGWSLGFGYKGVNLGMTFTGRFGGIVISETQSVLDAAGVSKVSADVRDAGGVQINQSKVSAQTYYQTIQGTAAYYTYSCLLYTSEMFR